MELMRVCKLLLSFIVVVLAGISAILAAQAASDSQQTQPTMRLAIVIGNSAYQSNRLEKLPNAANDANRVSESLKRLNFEVLTATDASSEQFGKLLAEVEAKLPSASAVLVFYAGHGIQMNGENYLLPTDTPDPDSIEKLTEKAVRLNEVIARLASRDRQTFVFLDACRNNPLADSQGGNGLAQVEVGENIFVAFATQPGNVTVDGASDNSPFTTALLNNMEIPGLSVSDMMIRVRNETEALTIGRQVPWDQSNLREQFYFTEQQMIDPVQLSASLSRILSDPVAKQRLQAELASNDLQTAVLIVGQALRSVAVPADQMHDGLIVGGISPANEAPGTQVASLDIAGVRKHVATDIGMLIVGTGSQAGNEATELTRNVQTELRRLGCYRKAIDGDWGKGSRQALRDFYRNTNQVASVDEPTVEVLSDLFLRSGRICKEPVIVTKVNSPRATDGNGNGAAEGRGRDGRRRGENSRRPAAPPPDINGGIGIGGIF